MLDVEPQFNCPHCKCCLTFLQGSIVKHLEGTFHICSVCNGAIDIFDTVKNRVDNQFGFGALFEFLSARTSNFEFSIELDTPYVLDLEKMGLPSSARVLYINYTPQGGGLFPSEAHGNSPIFRNNGLKRTLWPFPLGVNREEVSVTKVGCFITWIDSNYVEYEGIKGLVDAFEAFQVDDLESIIIPANTAVELPLTRFIDHVLGRHVSNKNIKRFMTDAATYSHQLNVLYPYLSVKEGYCNFSDHLRGNLNRLRGLRNKIAHTGKIEKMPTRSDMAGILTSALFANRYLNYTYKDMFSKH